jgi:hypothetical protein
MVLSMAFYSGACLFSTSPDNPKWKNRSELFKSLLFLVIAAFWVFQL